MSTKTHIIKVEEGQTENPVQLRASDPGSPVTNQLWVNTTSNTLKYYNGSSNVSVGSSASIAVYKRTTTQSIGSSSDTVVDFATSVIDTDSAVTTGGSWHWTAPRTGYVVVMANIEWAQFGGSNQTIAIRKNSTKVAMGGCNVQGSQDEANIVHANVIVSVTASDTIDVVAYQTSGSSQNIGTNNLGGGSNVGGTQFNLHYL